MNEYYVYTHENPITKDVFYVGIGKGNRAHNAWAGRNDFWQNYVNKHGFNVVIIASGLTRPQAGKIEVKLISELGRRQIDEGGVLVNRSEGGDGGSSGYTHTEEFKKNMSEARKGITKKPMSAKTKAKLSKSLKGRVMNWGKSVLQYDKQGNFIKEYPTAKAAKLETGAKNIFEVASGYKNQMYKSSGGYVWKYKN
jgi:hypothetical protein|tara:strand:- start:214 stop:801 length:588 start_codon:yes stop_codon:yes gene_type:complete